MKKWIIKIAVEEYGLPVLITGKELIKKDEDTIIVDGVELEFVGDGIMDIIEVPNSTVAAEVENFV